MACKEGAGLSLSSFSSVFLLQQRPSLSVSLLHFVVSSGSCVAFSGAPQGLGYVLFVFSCMSLSVLFFVFMFERCCFCCSSSSSSCSYFVLVLHVECLSCGRHGCGCSLLVSVWFSCHHILRYNKYFLTTTGQPHTPPPTFLHCEYTHAYTHTRTYTRRRTTTTVTQASQRRGPAVWPCAAQRCGAPGLSAGGGGHTGRHRRTNKRTNGQPGIPASRPVRGRTGRGGASPSRHNHTVAPPLCPVRLPWRATGGRGWAGRRGAAACGVPGRPRPE